MFLLGGIWKIWNWKPWDDKPCSLEKLNSSTFLCPFENCAESADGTGSQRRDHTNRYEHNDHLPCICVNNCFNAALLKHTSFLVHCKHIYHIISICLHFTYHNGIKYANCTNGSTDHKYIGASYWNIQTMIRVIFVLRIIILLYLWIWNMCR